MPDSAPSTSSTARENHEAYLIRERIAVGPSGIVYCAVQSGTGREVLFKVLMPESTNPLDFARVAIIKSSADKVRHPCIAEWIDAYSDPDGFVIVHDYKKGIGGNAFPTKGHLLSQSEGFHFAILLCEVLLAGEQAALPHGDIKPSNIVIWNDPAQGLSLQVLDWGLSICRSTHPSESLDCMAPERLQGGAPSMAGDFFSVGVTMTYLLTGCYPLRGMDKNEIIAGWQNFDPAAIFQARPDLDEQFCEWLGWLMRFNVNDRPASASEAYEVLCQIIDDATAAQYISDPASTRPDADPSEQFAADPLPEPMVRPKPPKALVRTVKDSGIQFTSPGSKKSRSRRVMQIMLAACLITAIFAGFCFWAQRKYGADWKAELAGRWHGYWNHPQKTEPYMAGTDDEMEEIEQPSQSALIATTASALFDARDFFAYPNNSSLEGANGGTGWSGPWRATNIKADFSADRKKSCIFLGGPMVTKAKREIGPFKNFESAGFFLVCSIRHPGADGPVISIDVLGGSNGTTLAPILLIPKGERLAVSIPDNANTQEIQYQKPLRLAAHWIFKKQPNKMYKVVLTVYLNPDLDAKPSPLANLPTIRQVIKNFTPSNAISLTMASISPSKQPAGISDIRISQTIDGALK